MEERKPVRMVQVDYKCPKCGIGYLRPTNSVFTTDPPQFAHKCNHCNYGQIFLNKAYPYIDYEPIEEHVIEHE